MNYADNPNYELIHTSASGVRFYVPTDKYNGYHISRKIAAEAQDMYSASGATKDVLDAIVKQMIEICNADNKKNDTVRSDISVLAHNIQYRLKYPVDEDCALRMSAIYLFIDGEDPDKVDPTFITKKTAIAKENPDTYAFFLHTGIELTASWKESKAILKSEDYLKTRQQVLKSMQLIK